MNKRAQEEVLGFVAIVVVVSIIGVILLFFVLRAGSSDIDKDSRDIMRFIESSMQYTSDCALDFETNYQKVRELIKECYDDSSRNCRNGESVCYSLNETLKGLLKAGWGEVDNSTFIKGYVFSSKFSRNSTSGIIEENIVELVEGQCDSNYRGYNLVISHYPGRIDNKLRLCLAQI